MSRAVRSFKVCQSMREALGVSAHGYNKMVRSCVRIATSRQSIEGENCSSTLSTCLRISSRSWRRSRTPRTTPSSYTHPYIRTHNTNARPVPSKPFHGRSRAPFELDQMPRTTRSISRRRQYKRLQRHRTSTPQKSIPPTVLRKALMYRAAYSTIRRDGLSTC